MPYLNPFTYARTMSPKDTFGIISYSNIVRHDQWPAFLYNLIQISYYSYFYYLSRNKEGYIDNFYKEGIDGIRLEAIKSAQYLIN